MEHCLFIVDLAIQHGGSFHRFLQLPSRPWMANGPWQVCDGYALHERLDGYHQYPNHSSCAESHGRNSGFSTFGFRSLDEKRIFSTCWEGSVLFFLDLDRNAKRMGRRLSYFLIQRDLWYWDGMGQSDALKGTWRVQRQYCGKLW